MVELKAKFRSLETPEGPYELSEAAGGAANLNREMIRLLDFAEQLEQALVHNLRSGGSGGPPGGFRRAFERRVCREQSCG